MTSREYADRLHEHVHQFFRGHEAEMRVFDQGPIQQVIPGFHVIEIGPGIRSRLWTYVSVGCGFPRPDREHLEFLIIAPEPSMRHVELLAMTAHYHHGRQLGLGHTFPIGESWLPESSLDHMVVSLPYPYGKALEIFEFEGHHVHLFWCLPITQTERAYKAANGLEALEAKFETLALEYWNPKRSAVV